jgi:hypothetical protein
LSKATPADGPGFASKPDSLGVSEALGFAAELFEENAVLFLEVFDDGLLMSIDPSRDGNEEELQLSCHGIENLSRVPAAQSPQAVSAEFFGTTGSTALKLPSVSVAIELLAIDVWLK